MQFELGIFLFELLILFGCIKWVFPFLFLGKEKDISVADFLNNTALLIGSLTFFGCVVSTLFFPSTSYIPALVCLMALSGSFLFYYFRKNEKIALLSTVIFCSLGVFLLPDNAPVASLTTIDVLTKIASVCCWVLFIYMMQKLDRIPFFSFSAFSALFIFISLMASTLFLFFNPIFSILSFSALGLSATASLLLKKRNVMWFGPTLSFFLAYLAGYFGVYTTALGQAAILPIFIAFELLEITAAFTINLLKNKKLLPLTTPFLVEQAYLTGKNVSKAVKKLFWTCFFFSGLGFVFIYVNARATDLNKLDNFWVILIVTSILLINSYTVFSSWGKEKKEFKNLFKDIKQEFKTISEEIKNAKKK